MKTGKLGSFTLALALVILSVLALRVYLIPSLKTAEQSSAPLIKNQLGISLIPDFSSIGNVSDKKQAFFDFLRPAVQKQNSIIAEERKFLEQVQKHLQNQHQLNDAEQYRIQRLAEKYQYAMRAIDSDSINKLLRRVDVIPESMVLIQAANETGWGSSRFAREGLNFFGQWCFKKGCGLVPQSRSEGMSHEVAVFKSVDDSVASYMRNLNSNAAYSLFRSIRADLRSQQEPLTAEKLVYGLVNYSERQEAYIDELLDMLRHNEEYLVENHVEKTAV
ncbi:MULTISPECIES: glucosaminidase domain-containing protein [Shewanella]|uniref:Glucosaminidase domain-containing protein n=1 Tax=Shewanella indica TaxID=768528 RepID=A0ABU4QHK7_9GAMM|nr:MULTISPECIES: glucosaminidase domain-containing protein [Shewanella]OIN08765.1 glucosaminidase [Shewanella algae]BCV36730.1 glycoside hydrolase family 73 [Shewanella chilikensis]MCE9790078.1 glucosaminidase domain-containing protein [Shewanella indica]MDX6017990.1 glucosaminidase domain-containing protein [Shewanella indica]NDO73337.1 glucosaminidase [Shewanella sp. SE1]